jgi:hypothetical protein
VSESLGAGEVLPPTADAVRHAIADYREREAAGPLALDFQRHQDFLTAVQQAYWRAYFAEPAPPVPVLGVFDSVR